MAAEDNSSYGITLIREFKEWFHANYITNKSESYITNIPLKFCRFENGKSEDIYTLRYQIVYILYKDYGLYSKNGYITHGMERIRENSMHHKMAPIKMRLYKMAEEAPGLKFALDSVKKFGLNYKMPDYSYDG